MDTSPATTVETRLLVMSDTHAQIFQPPLKPPKIDLLVHCGDLTQHSQLSEIKTTLRLLDSIDAPLKLVIAGNHDFSFDTPVFTEKTTEAKNISDDLDDNLIQAKYGKPGDAKELFDQARDRGIHLLDEGTHNFTLQNGARLKVYASPYTPCPAGEEPTWGFQYHDRHDFDIEDGTDLVVTHGPPHGIFDVSQKVRLGCHDLFRSVANSKPKVHFFGHIHDGWGAKVVTWRKKLSDNPSHFNDIDHGRSTTIKTLAALGSGDDDTGEFCRARYPAGSEKDPEEAARRTLFVNAAVQGENGLEKPPWIIDVDLQPAESSPLECGENMEGPGAGEGVEDGSQDE